MDRVTEARVRALSPTQLEIEKIRLSTVPTATEEENELEVEILPESDPVLIQVRVALKLGFAGVILSGPPGTGKSFFAKRIAHTISGDPSAVRVVQFHASYQYEDFMQGFVPADDGSGFELQNKVFPLMCKRAMETKETHVIVIDEISRCDVARVFGEALTYLEPDKRERTFYLSSGKPLSVPRNLIIIATMNPWDKGVDELDVALERRFAQIDMLPDSKALRTILETKKADPELTDRLVDFFEKVQALDDDMVHLGHAYFSNCIDEESAGYIWSFRLLPFFTKACRLDKEMLSQIKRLWNRVVTSAPSNQTVEAQMKAVIGAETAGQASPKGENTGDDGA